MQSNETALNMDVLRGLTNDESGASQPQSHTKLFDNDDANTCWGQSYNSRTQANLLQTEKLAALGTFASGIAHDINNPLYVMIGLAENILNERDFEVIHERAQSIVDAGKRIQTTCRNITQYARAANGMDLVQVDVTDTLNEAIKIAQYASTIDDLSVVKRYARPLKTLAIPQELLQVFVNLMTNAIQAMKGKGTLTLSTCAEDGYAKIAITDTGCGIASENLEKIFHPFFTTKSASKGTGLGLHNVREIIKKYNGELSVESERGKGTTFFMKLPNTQTG